YPLRHFAQPTTVSLICSVFIFFFQAEDGIRDFHVTGVQTCALPIWVRPLLTISSARPSRSVGGARSAPGDAAITSCASASSPGRSEERRVGKEWRSRTAPGR